MEDGGISLSVEEGWAGECAELLPAQQMVMVMDHWRLGRLPDRIDTLQLRYRYIYTSH